MAFFSSENAKLKAVEKKKVPNTNMAATFVTRKITQPCYLMCPHSQN
jgi:hypothetical protein